MPPRFAYWTILIDDKPTAFRAREREELLPTFGQLQRKNTNVTMHWFARGRLWASREAERDDFQMRKHAAAAPRDRRADRPEGAERRGSDWRPGGAHKDPRDRFKKKNRPERAWSEKDPATQRDRDKPGPPRRNVGQGFPGSPKRDERERGSPARPSAWSDKPAGPPRGDRRWSGKPGGDSKRPWTPKPPYKSDGGREARRSPSDSRTREDGPSDRPWQTKPTGPRAQRKPWSNSPAGDAPRGDRPCKDNPREARRSSSGPQSSGGGWSGKPRDQHRTPFTPREPQSGGTPVNGAPRKRRRDEPPDRG